MFSLLKWSPLALVLTAVCAAPYAHEHHELMAVHPQPAPKYYFDVKGHSQQSVLALLNRAEDLYREASPERRKALRIVMVLHGPDVRYFTASDDATNDILTLAERLDAEGIVDFKMCAKAAKYFDIDRDKVPSFVEFVPYGMAEIVKLEEGGFVRL
ncbi:MAG: DsrE family protein [Pseudomonadota bacterium]